MLKFFRRIRHRLLDSGKIKTYLVYAVGEILLVVIGILLALQLNNWNESRKDRATEINILNNIKEALHSDLDNTITNNMITCNKAISISETILKCSEENLAIPDSIKSEYVKLTRGRVFSPNLTPYKILESKGLDLVRNEKLQLMIAELYNKDYVFLNQLVENYQNNLTSFDRPLIRKHFKIRPNSYDFPYKPYNEKEMLADPEFMNTIGLLIRNNRGLLFGLENLKEQIDKILVLIESEVKTSKK